MNDGKFKADYARVLKAELLLEARDHGEITLKGITAWTGYHKQHLNRINRNLEIRRSTLEKRRVPFMQPTGKK